jgi:hypothetical protein
MKPIRVAIASLGAATAVLAGAALAGASAVVCPGLYPGGTVPFTGLFPAIERRMALSSFAPGQIVEIDFVTMPETEFIEHVKELQALPARVSVYLVGGHCYVTSDDCAKLEAAGIRLGTTGSWNWDKEERRVLDIAQPASLARLAEGAERGWRLGANYIRVDNLHHPAGSSEPRTADQMAAIFQALHAVEDRLRANGVIPADRPTGVVAHNNLEAWEQLIREGRLARPPVFLTSERTAQLAFKGEGYKGDVELKAGRLTAQSHPEIASGSRIALALGIPYTVAEFAISHDLGADKASTYRLPQAYIDSIRAMPGVSDVIIIPDETHYVGRGTSYDGRGPRAVSAAAFPPNSGAIAAACIAK